MLAFNGHDGLMDFQVDYYLNTDSIEKDAVVIACSSYEYFKDHLGCAKGFPLITTNGLLAPEAYVFEAVVNSWALLKTPRQIEESAAQAYASKHSCGIKGGRWLFISGWNKK